MTAPARPHSRVETNNETDTPHSVAPPTNLDSSSDMLRDKNADPKTTDSSSSGVSPKARRIGVLGLWVILGVTWLIYQRSTGQGATDTLQSLIDTARGAWWAPLIFLAAYIVRPLVLFSATLLTVTAGILFGPVVGVILTVIGANMSAMVAYWIGRGLAGEADSTGDDSARDDRGSQVRSLFGKWAERMRQNSFSTVLTMRLLFLPYDAVNYTAGALRIKPLPFLLASALGALPGTISFVLVGASLDRIDMGFGGLDPRAIVASVVIFVISLAVAKKLQRNEPAEIEVAQ